MIRRYCRQFTLLCCGLALMMPFMAYAQRSTDYLPYTYEHFSKWLLKTVDGLHTHPAAFFLVFDRTDSIMSTGKNENLLPNTWNSEFFIPFRNQFLVPKVQELPGDEIAVVGFGRLQNEVINPLQEYKDNELTYPFPFRDTNDMQKGSDIGKSLTYAIDLAKQVSPNKNIVVLLFTDDQTEGVNNPSNITSKSCIRYYSENALGGHREFTVYCWWNDFPDQRKFYVMNPGTLNYTEEQRIPRAETLRDKSSYINPVESRLVETPNDISLRALLRVLPWVLLILAIIVTILLIFLDWWTVHYKVMVNGKDHLLRACKMRKPQNIAVDNPKLRMEKIGQIRVIGSGVFGNHRLIFIPTKPYLLTNEQGTVAQQKEQASGQTKSSFLPITAKKGGRFNSLIRFQPNPAVILEDTTPSNETEPTANLRCGEIVLSVQEKGIFASKSKRPRRMAGKKPSLRPSAPVIK